jgi:hypothetical protein
MVLLQGVDAKARNVQIQRDFARAQGAGLVARE